MGGDIVNQNGTGAITVYNDKQTIPAELNDLKFNEPYLLAASANEEGQTGCQFFITLQELPPLNGSHHTIFGRLVNGSKILHQIEGHDELI